MATWPGRKLEAMENERQTKLCAQTCLWEAVRRSPAAGIIPIIRSIGICTSINLQTSNRSIKTY